MIDPVPREGLMANTFLGAEIVKQHLLVTSRAAGSPTRIDRDPPCPAVRGYALTRSLGCADGFIDSSADDDEALVSLKIL